LQAGFFALMVHKIQQLLLTLRWPSLRLSSYRQNKTSNRDNGPIHSLNIVREKLLRSHTSSLLK
jgi:hypothetical protein